MNEKEAGEYYATIYGDGHDVVYGVASFVWMGHFLTVDLLTEGEEDTFIHIRSTGSRRIEGGTFPVEFAESGAWEIINDNFTGKGGDWQTLRAEIRATVNALKNAGEFGDN